MSRGLYGLPKPVRPGYARELEVRYGRPKRIGTPAGKTAGVPHDAFAAFQCLFEDVPQEQVVVLAVDNHHKIIGFRRVSLGTLNMALMQPRDVFLPVLLGGGAGAIVGHNHPSGRADVSHNDLIVTKNLILSGQILGIPLLDHLVCGSGEFNSVRAMYPDMWRMRG